MYKFLSLLAAVFWLQLLGGTESVAQAATDPSASSSELYLADHLVSLANFTTVGDVRHAAEPNRAILALGSSSSASLQPRSYLPVTTQLTPKLEEIYDLDFSLSGFAPGDRFSVIYPATTDQRFYSYDCAITYNQKFQHDSIRCHVSQHYDGQSTPVNTNYYSNATGNSRFTNDTIYTLTIYKTAKSLYFRLWQKDRPEIGIQSFSLGSLSATPAPSIAPPKIILDQRFVASSQATLAVHRFYSYGPDYFYAWPVDLLAQNDPSWSHELLGHTTDQTIGQIGCLLTSAAMILRTHGYYQFPDGTPLNPSTLNQWLQSQKDGYINKNLLNLSAVTRLSNQLHQFYYLTQGLRLPKFEYRAYGNPNVLFSYYSKYLLDSLHQEQPVIMEIPGHFLVADGVTSPYAFQVSIKDPQYTTYTHFRQHQTAPVSLRRLIPSFTDQSFFLVNFIGDANAQLFDQDGNPVYFEKLDLYEPETNQVIGKQYLIAQPVSGDYSLRVTRHEPGTQFTFFVYNDQGEVATYSDEPINLDYYQKIDFSYQKDQATGFFTLSGGEPPAPPDPWAAFFAAPAWPWQFTRLVLIQLHAAEKYNQLQLSAQDFHARGLIPDALYGQLEQLLASQ